ncbi:hypothetical protein BC835DRAFT_1302645 [Cytidiella melzeri]|nr:hypothetical protein BC835DRAFT_1302645 [Cytidiella melzeri]
MAGGQLNPKLVESSELEDCYKEKYVGHMKQLKKLKQYQRQGCQGGQDLREDGWLVDEQDRLLLWIPLRLRDSLLWNSAQNDVLCRSFSTRVDVTDFREDGWRSRPWGSDVERT